MTMRTIEQAGELKGKTVFMRADFDVPVVNGSIGEPFRIQRQKENLDYLTGHGARVVIGSHITSAPSFEPLKPQLEQLLGVTFGNGVTLLENTRQSPGEEANDETFAHTLVLGCDIYVNNAFAVCHRAHASVVAAAQLLPAYAGLLVAQETANLSRVVDAPAEGKVIFIGGAKASTKMPVIEHLLDKADAIALGGVVANEMSAPTDARIRVPSDFVTDGGPALDIGPETAKVYAGLAANATMIIWNGPMGKFEDPRYLPGTRALAEAVASSHAFSVIGGGDTIAAITKLNIPLEKFGFVSTGGGAMLDFLAGERMPGLEALGYYP